MRTLRALLVQLSLQLGLLGLLTSVGGGCTQAISDGLPNQGGSSQGGAGGGDQGGGDQGGGDPGGGGSGGGAGGSSPGLADILLVHGDDSVVVDVAVLPTQVVKDVAVVPLPAVWGAGALTPDTSELVFDFEGDDGFHPSNKPSCSAYVTAEQLELGYVIPETRSLVWDESLGFPGCYGVKSVAKIIALDP